MRVTPMLIEVCILSIAKLDSRSQKPVLITLLSVGNILIKNFIRNIWIDGDSDWIWDVNN